MSKPEEQTTEPNKTRKPYTKKEKLTPEQQELKAIQLRKEIEAAKDAELEPFNEPIQTLVEVFFNDLLFNNMTHMGIKPLNQNEVTGETKVIVRALDELGWLRGAENPFLALALTTGSILMPRTMVYINYKKSLKDAETTAESSDFEGDPPTDFKKTKEKKTKYEY